MGWRYTEYVAPIYQGDIDHSRIISILRKAGYEGDITIEDESLSKFPGSQREEILKKDVKYLQKILK